MKEELDRLRAGHTRQTAEGKADFDKEMEGKMVSLGKVHATQLQALKVDTEKKLTAAKKMHETSHAAHRKELAETQSAAHDALLQEQNQADHPPDARSPKPETRNPKPETRNPNPENRKPKPGTRNPKPQP